MAQTFPCHFKNNPRLDPDGKHSPILLNQYKSYKNEDPPPKQQKALPGCVLIELHKNRSTERSSAIADLCTGPFFFAMRSCEYLSVTGQERKTRQIRLRNIRFFRHNRLTPHSSQDLHLCEFVSVTFEDQKNALKNDTVTMHCSNHDLMCPIKSGTKGLTLQRSNTRLMCERIFS